MVYEIKANTEAISYNSIKSPQARDNFLELVTNTARMEALFSYIWIIKCMGEMKGCLKPQVLQNQHASWGENSFCTNESDVMS